MVATAKSSLKAGDTLDGEGGYAVYGKIMRAETRWRGAGCRSGSRTGSKLVRPVAGGAAVSWDDVAIEEGRRSAPAPEMERAFAPKARVRRPAAA